MGDITWVDRIVYGILSVIFGTIFTMEIVLPLILMTIGGISHCEFPDGIGPCTSQFISLLTLPFLIVINSVLIYWLVMKFKKGVGNKLLNSATGKQTDYLVA